MTYEDALALDMLEDADLGNGWRATYLDGGKMLVMNTETGERIILPPEAVAELRFCMEG